MSELKLKFYFSPFLSGEYEGWCSQWQEGSSQGASHWVDLEREDCWLHCDLDTACFQAVYEAEWSTDQWAETIMELRQHSAIKTKITAPNAA